MITNQLLPIENFKSTSEVFPEDYFQIIYAGKKTLVSLYQQKTPISPQQLYQKNNFKLNRQDICGQLIPIQNFKSTSTVVPSEYFQIGPSGNPWSGYTNRNFQIHPISCTRRLLSHRPRRKSLVGFSQQKKIKFTSVVVPTYYHQFGLAENPLSVCLLSNWFRSKSFVGLNQQKIPYSSQQFIDNWVQQDQYFMLNIIIRIPFSSMLNSIKKISNNIN